jgi:hypothetical protein
MRLERVMDIGRGLIERGIWGEERGQGMGWIGKARRIKKGN